MVVLLLGLFRIELFFVLTVKKYVSQKGTGLVLDCTRQYHHMGTVRLHHLSSRCRRECWFCYLAVLCVCFLIGYLLSLFIYF